MRKLRGMNLHELESLHVLIFRQLQPFLDLIFNSGEAKFWRRNGRIVGFVIIEKFIDSLQNTNKENMRLIYSMLCSELQHSDDTQDKCTHRLSRFRAFGGAFLNLNIIVTCMIFMIAHDWKDKINNNNNKKSKTKQTKNQREGILIETNHHNKVDREGEILQTMHDMFVENSTYDLPKYLGQTWPRSKFPAETEHEFLPWCLHWATSSSCAECHKLHPCHTEDYRDPIDCACRSRW